MKYLMLVYGNEEIWGSHGPEEFREFVGAVDAWNQELRDSGELLAAEGLAGWPHTVRRVDGAPVVTDGPYLEAKEHVGSYSLFDLADEDRAVEVVRSYPGIAFGGGVEIWPLMVHGGADV